MNAATRSRTARRRPPTDRDLGDAAHGPLRLVIADDGASTTKRPRPQHDLAVVARESSKKPKLVEGPLGDESGTKQLNSDGVVLREDQMRHGRAVHAHDDVGLRDLRRRRVDGVGRLNLISTQRATWRTAARAASAAPQSQHRSNVA